MRLHFPCVLLLLVPLLLANPAAAQDSVLIQLPSRYFSEVAGKVNKLQAKLNRKTEQTLAALEQREQKLWRKAARLDSLKGAAGLEEAKQRYAALRSKLQQKSTVLPSQYLPYLDTLKTSLKFLSNNRNALKGIKDAHGKLSSSQASVQELEHAIKRTEDLRAFIKERKSHLQEQLQGLPITKELKRLNKQAYYYAAQVTEYKEVLRDRKKVERKAVGLLSKTKPFQEFMRKHSQLASLFRLPGSEGAEQGSTTALQGLQTRASVQQALQQRFGSGVEASQMLQQNVQQAQSQLGELKSKAAQYTSGSFDNSSSDVEMPKGFRPNSQKSKPFLKRLEWGSNVQSQRARNYFPVTSDIGFSVGYRLSDKSVVGVGASYKLGWGRGWQHLALSHQGVGLRSYVDWKLKGSIYITSGYEQNYRSAFNSVDALKEYSAWQSSGLVGLTKKYNISRKMKGSMQLLWDFLSFQQVPRTQAVIWRVGYGFN